MINILRVEWIKTKRTMLREVLILSPIVFSLLAFWQLTKRLLDDEIIKNAFLIRGLFFKFFLPLLVGFISSYLIGYEQIYGNNVYLNNRIPKVKFCLGKILSIFIYIVFIILVMDLIYFFTLKFLKIELPYKILFFSSTITFIGFLPIIILHVFVSFKWGMGYSIGLGIVGTLLSAIVTAGLGHKIWFLIPWSIPSLLNLNSIVFLRNVKVTKELTKLLAQYSPFQIYLSVSLNGIISSIAYTIIF
ncbi:MAG: ABC transporter permease, partial [Fervidobacterium sp.]